MGRKGISMERTFRPISDRLELEAKVRWPWVGHYQCITGSTKMGVPWAGASPPTSATAQSWKPRWARLAVARDYEAPIVPNVLGPSVLGSSVLDTQWHSHS